MQNYLLSKYLTILIRIISVLAIFGDYNKKYKENDFEYFRNKYNEAVNNKKMNDSLIFYTAELSHDILNSITLYTKIINSYSSSPFHSKSLYRLSKYYFIINDTIKAKDIVKRLIYANDGTYSPFGYITFIAFYERNGDFESTKKLITEFAEKYSHYPFLKYYKIENQEHTIIDASFYSVQIGAFMKKDNADKMRDEFIKKGYEAFVITKDNMYKVMVGKFEDAIKAASYSSVLQKSEGISVWTVKVE